MPLCVYLILSYDALIGIFTLNHFQIIWLSISYFGTFIIYYDFGSNFIDLCLSFIMILFIIYSLLAIIYRFLVRNIIFPNFVYVINAGVNFIFWLSFLFCGVCYFADTDIIYILEGSFVVILFSELILMFGISGKYFV